MALLDRLARLPLAVRGVLALVAIAIATAAAALYGADVAQAALFLLVAVVAASLGGRRVAIGAALVAAVVLNFGFTPPRWTLRVGSGDDAVALVVFTLVAIATSSLVAAVAESRRVAERRARAAELALAVSGRLRAGDDPDAVIDAALARLAVLFGPGVVERDGEGLRVASVAARIDDDDRAVLESALTSLSETLERLRFAREAEQARVDAEVSRTRAMFLSAVSHNLRTPLAAVHAASGTLLAPDAVLDDLERRELLETVRDETARLERLVAKVLELGTIRAGGLELAPQAVDVEGLLQTAVHRLRPLLGDRVVHVEADDDLGDVRLDPTALEQVLLNLLENALRWAPAASAIDVVATRRRGQVELRVVDHGPGVAPGERERVFEEFYRTGGRAESDGTGLGLAIVKALVTAQGGRVWVEDTPGGGATFVVRLPRVQAP